MQDSSYISRDDSDGLFSQLRSGNLEMQRGVSDAHCQLPFISIQECLRVPEGHWKPSYKTHNGYMAIMSQMCNYKADTHALQP